MSIKIRAYRLQFTSLFSSVNSNLNNKNIISSGLSLTWGTIALGGYTIIGNLVVVNVRVITNQILNAASTYDIMGFPLAGESTANYISASCSLTSLTRIIYMNPLGTLQFIPDQEIASGAVFLFSCCYIRR